MEDFSHDPVPEANCQVKAKTPSKRSRQSNNRQPSTSKKSKDALPLALDSPSIAAEVEEVRPGQCRSFYVQSGNKKLLLLTMVTGLHNGDFDCSADPYKPLGENNKLKKPDLQKEAMCHGLAWKLVDASHREPKLSGWGIPQLLKWLEENTVDDPADMEFLLKEEQIYYTDLGRAMAEKHQSDETNKNGGNWTQWCRGFICIKWLVKMMQKTPF